MTDAVIVQQDVPPPQHNRDGGVGPLHGVVGRHAMRSHEELGGSKLQQLVFVETAEDVQCVAGEGHRSLLEQRTTVLVPGLAGRSGKAEDPPGI